VSGESLTPLNDRLQVLQAEEAAAFERSQSAAAALKDEWTVSRDLFEPWTDALRRNEEPTPDQLREWTSDLLAAISERGLVLSLDPRSPGHRALVAIDPAIRQEASEAQYAAGQARSARVAFEVANQAELAAEKDYAAAKNFREKIDTAECIEEIRAALA
jgi:hypothetical protein